MNVFHRVTLRSLRKNRTRTAVTIIGVILSAAMICAVTTFASSLRNYAMQAQIYSAGNWHGYALNRELQTCQAVKDSDQVEEAVCFQQLGYAVAEGCENEFKPYIYLLGADGNAADVLPIHMISGRLPASTDEILLPEHLWSDGGVRYALGDRLTLSLGQRVLDGDVLTQVSPCYAVRDGDFVSNGETLEIRETRTYTVVGFYERLNWEIEDYSAPGYTALTLADREASQDYAYDVYFRMKNPDEVYDFMVQNGLGGNTNRDLLMISGTFRFSTFQTMLYSLAAIVIGLIMFGSVALIYNAFSISVSERTKQFGLLSSVGATKKQLRRMVLFEALTVSLVGIPIGILSGIGGIGVTLWLLGDKFHTVGFENIDMTLSVSPLSVVIAAAVALVTVLISAWIPSKRATKVSAVEAIRQNADISAKGKPVKTSKLTYKLFGLPGVLAQKHYKRSRKKYRATVLSLFMSVVLFVSASAFTEYLSESVSGGFDPAGYDLLYTAYPSEFDQITPEELLERLKGAKSVTGGSYSRNCYGTAARVRSEYLSEQGNAFLASAQGSAFLASNSAEDEGASALDMLLCVCFVDDGSFRELLQKNGLQAERFMDPEHPLAVALDGIMTFNLETQKYERVRFFGQDEFEVELQEERKIPGYAFYDTDVDEEGNFIYRYLKEGAAYEDGELLELTEDEAIEIKTLSVGKVITERPDFLQSVDSRWLIYPLSLSDAIYESFSGDPDDPYSFTLLSDRHRESFEAVKTVLRENRFSEDDLRDIAELEESDRNIVTIIRVFSYGFIVLISLIAAANVFNTISTNVSLRRREFAMLKSVGMTGKGFDRMMNYECILYGSRALLYGLPASCAVTWLIYRAVMSGYETEFRLPWAAIGIATLSVFLVVFATMMYAMRKIKKDNPIDALKNENL